MDIVNNARDPPARVCRVAVSAIQIGEIFMASENSPSQPDNSNSEMSFDDLQRLLSDYGISLKDFLKRISEAVRLAYWIYDLPFNSADMEDIAQSIILLLIRNRCRVLRSFERRSSLENWLQPIANHKTIRFYRGRNDMMDLEDLLPNDLAYPPSQDGKVLRDEVARKLTKGQRELLELIRQGFKTKEIAERKGIKPDSVSKEKRRLFDKIREILKSKERGDDKYSGG